MNRIDSKDLAIVELMVAAGIARRHERHGPFGQYLRHFALQPNIGPESLLAFARLVAEDAVSRVGRSKHERALEQALDSAEAKVVTLGQEVSGLTSSKDAAYLERNQVVAALASAFPSGIAKTAIEGWDEAWHGCVYIDLPTGQASWHYHESQAHLFAHLPPYAGQWDGHTTPEKYERLAGLATDVHLARTPLERYDLEQSPDYRKGWHDGRLHGYEVGGRHARQYMERHTPVTRDKSEQDACGDATGSSPACDTCEGLGTIDETLGSCSRLGRRDAPCPDCDGTGRLDR